FSQTFCYREVAELRRQNFALPIFSVRRPKDEPAQDWDPAIVAAVEYLPGEEQLVGEVDRALRKKKLPVEAAREIKAWDRQSDFLRLYQAAWLGPRLQALGVQHLHAHFAGLAARTAYWIERFFGIGFSLTAHANDIFAPKPFTISLGKLVEAARAIITETDFSVRFLCERYPEAAAKIHRVYNGIDVAGFRKSDFPAAPPLILSIGRLIEKKGFEDLIEACRLLAAQGVDFRCEIIGEGPLQSLLEERISAASLTKTVSLAGPLPQSEVRRRLARGTVFALPCVAEVGGGMDNLPTVIMEAMAAALPVVSTRIAGVPEMVRDGVTGFLVPEHAPAALTEKLTNLLTNRGLARSLGESGHQRAAELFSIEQSVRSLRQVLAR
ncbi:MAG: glycosyltransferase family 4 protein, partial [Rhodanobacteraceae bacterium]